MNIPDPYKVLQVDPEAEDEVIEAAYRRLARKYHPDVATGPDAQDRMVRINQAWEMLREPMKRAAVDRARLRNANTAARVAAADAQARASARERPASRGQANATGSAAGPAQPRSSQANGERPGSGFPGMHDPGDSELGARTQFVSPNWTSGRSNQGHRYEAGTMQMAQGDGAAGPPPGGPAGSVLNFGRYSGWSLGEIARMDLEYLEWLDRTPIGRTYQAEIDEFLRAYRRRRVAAVEPPSQRGLFRRR